MDYHLARAGGYLTAVIAWTLVARAVPSLWPDHRGTHFTHPGRELGWAVAGIVLTLILGFAYVRGWLLPGSRQDRPLVDLINLLLVFAPTLLVPVLRRHSLDTAWLPDDAVPVRIATGVLLSLPALTVFAFLHDESWLGVMRTVYHHTNLSALVQLLLEDVAVAILCVRVAGVLGLRAAPLLTAILFTAGHASVMVQTGITATELGRVALDVALGYVVVATVQRSGDVWWFWGVHFAMDMTQFFRAPA